jgi:hypothetical protein
VGYALLTSLEPELTVSALRMAISERNPLPGCIHHALAALVVFMTGAVRRERAKEEQIRAGIRRVIEAYNTNNPDLLDKTIAPGCVTHTPPYPDIKGLAATK